MIKILWSGSNQTIDYAAKEFKKYLDMVTGTLDYAVVENVEALPTQIKENQIVLGLLEEFGLDATGVEDAELDDLEDVKIVNGSGYIAGSNPRSVLFGVYDYFKAKGCAWSRPGINGEKIVKFDPMNHEFTYRKLADVRFRGECLEGAVKYEHVKATIQWAPKAHMNLFMIQYPVPRPFMNYWYTHFGNTKLPSEEIDYETMEGLTTLIEKDAYRCGLQLHALGHGYQFLPYGVSPSPVNDEYNLTEGAKKAVALVNGERKFLHGGVPTYSQICMGNDEILKDQVEWLANYAESKPEITVMHVWLGDAYDNHCECPLCTPHHPSDLYVKMLNMLDEELTRRNIKTKVAFCAYVDTFWAPEKEKFNNCDRFILTSSISGRDYNKPYDDTEYEGDIPKWERNHYSLPANFPLRRKMFSEWKKMFSGDDFAFEYHFYTMHFNDPGTLRVAKNFYADLHQLKPLGFGGIMSCQSQRLAFPSAFQIALVGEALFDLSRSYEELEAEYFSNAFGDGWETVREYLSEICDAIDSRVIGDTVAVDFADKLFKPSWFDNKEFGGKLLKVPEIVAKYKDIFKRYENNENNAISRAYKLLAYHGEYCERLSKVYYQGTMGNIENLEKEYDSIIDWLSGIEMEIQYEFDLRLFKRGFDGKVAACKNWIANSKK